MSANGTTKLVWWGMGIVGSLFVGSFMLWMTTMYSRLEAATLGIGDLQRMAERFSSESSSINANVERIRVHFDRFTENQEAFNQQVVATMEVTKSHTEQIKRLQQHGDEINGKLWKKN